MKHTTALLAAFAAGALLAACSAADASGTDDGTITVTGVDYGFEDLPDEVPVGTTLAFHNSSDEEFHELAVVRVADDEERSLDELLALPEDEIGGVVTFVGVAAAGPGEDGAVVQGELALDEPGRYLATCFIPVGADPAVVEEALAGAEGQTDGPPDFGDGAPHATVGMVTEFQVTG